MDNRAGEDKSGALGMNGWCDWSMIRECSVSGSRQAGDSQEGV